MLTIVQLTGWMQLSGFASKKYESKKPEISGNVQVSHWEFWRGSPTRSDVIPLLS